MSDTAAGNVSLPPPIPDPVGDEIIEITAVVGTDGEAIIARPVAEADADAGFDQLAHADRQIFVVEHPRRQRFVIVTCWLLSLLALVLVVAAALGLLAVVSAS